MVLFECNLITRYQITRYDMLNSLCLFFRRNEIFNILIWDWGLVGLVILLISFLGHFSSFRNWLSVDYIIGLKDFQSSKFSLLA